MPDSSRYGLAPAAGESQDGVGGAESVLARVRIVVQAVWRRAWVSVAGDVVLAVVVAGLGVGGALVGRSVGRGVRPGQVVLLAALGGVLVLRRRRPVAVVVAVVVAVAVLYGWGAATEAAFPAVLIAGYSVGAHATTRARQVVGGAAVTALAAAALGDLAAPSALPIGLVRALLAGAGAGLVGAVVRRQVAARDALAQAADQRAVQAEQRRVEEGARATAAERLRIARELHDVVSHQLTVVVVQAQAARRVMSREPAMALEAMATVERAGRTALLEMRTLLGVLHDAGTGAHRQDEPNPQPTVDDLHTLVDQVRAAGLRAHLEIDGRVTRLSAGTELSVYRIVQEALTNTIKHCGSTTARVRLHFGHDRLTVTVDDDGPTSAAARMAPVPGSGRGLTGIRERATLLGGGSVSGPRPGGGYRVRVTLPLPDADHPGELR